MGNEQIQHQHHQQHSPHVQHQHVQHTGHTPPHMPRDLDATGMHGPIVVQVGPNYMSLQLSNLVKLVAIETSVALNQIFIFCN